MRGYIHAADKPVAGGWVEFLPIDGTVGNFRVAPIDRAGRFEIDGVGVGRHVVGLAHTDLEQPFASLFDTFRTPVRRVIPAGDLYDLDLDLVAEATRIEADLRK